LCHPGEGRDPVDNVLIYFFIVIRVWIPASAGMTVNITHYS